MKRCKAILLAALAAFSIPAMADSVTISTGSKGGSYYNVFGVNLTKVLREYGYKSELLTSKGSMENNDRVGGGQAHIGFTQADAYASWLKKKPEMSANTMVVGKLGMECAYIAVAKGGKINDEDDLGKGTRIAVQKQGSGTAETWAYMQQLEDDYREASTHFQGGAIALTQLRTGNLDAVMWVANPYNLNDKNLRIVRESPDLKLIDVNDYSLNDKLPNGEAVYRFEPVKLEDAVFADKVETVCTDILVVASLEADEEVLETLASILALNAGRIAATK